MDWVGLWCSSEGRAPVLGAGTNATKSTTG